MTNQTEYVAMAKRIADDICQQAYWLEDKCNWTGVFHHSQIANSEVVLRALPSNFYTGSAGVAYFLSASYHVFSDENYKKTALGAWKKTIDQLPKIKSNNVGFYEGLGGIAFSLVQSGVWLKSDEILAAGLDLANHLSKFINQSSFDIMEGCAGGIIALAAIYRLFPSKILKNAIVDGGEYLLKNAQASQKGLSWKTLATQGPNLTGYSQGSAGIIHALAEVHAVHAENRYLEAIEKAVLYENSFYSTKFRNWKDLRILHQKHARRSRVYRTNAWCHGASGIGLSRLRTYQLTDLEFLKSDIMKSAETITQIKFENTDVYTLCHGLTGDLLQLRALENFLKKDELTQNLHFGLTKLNTSLQNLPLPDSKDHFLQNPSFMQGWAGIGYFLLLLQKPDLPNVLMMGLE